MNIVKAAFDPTSVIKLSAVVGSREEGDQLALGEELVSVFYNLGKMGW